MTWIFCTNGFIKNELQWLFKSKKSSVLLKQVNGGQQLSEEKFQFMDFESSFNEIESDITKNTEQYPKCFHMANCFNFKKCQNGFLVYVYPIQDKEFLSPLYSEVLNSIKSSTYYTDDPSKACLFVISLDTLDRDTLSKDFVKKMKNKIEHLNMWNNGENHLIINLFSGTFPNYDQNLLFNVGKAIVAKASSSLEVFRKGYDISLPLLPKFTPKPPLSFIFKEQDNKEVTPYLFPSKRKYLLSFKGKRYVFGIGSESRNALHLINNNKDILLITTCKHGKNWEKYQDDRCKEDNAKYERFGSFKI